MPQRRWWRGDGGFLSGDFRGRPEYLALEVIHEPTLQFNLPAGRIGTHEIEKVGVLEHLGCPDRSLGAARWRGNYSAPGLGEGRLEPRSWTERISRDHPYSLARVAYHNRSSGDLSFSRRAMMCLHGKDATLRCTNSPVPPGGRLKVHLIFQVAWREPFHVREGVPKILCQPVDDPGTLALPFLFLEDPPPQFPIQKNHCRIAGKVLSAVLAEFGVSTLQATWRIQPEPPQGRSDREWAERSMRPRCWRFAEKEGRISGLRTDTQSDARWPSAVLISVPTFFRNGRFYPI